MFSPSGRRRAFTLIELLVVIAIIAVLVGLLLPAVQKVREASSRVKCANNIHQIAVAAHAYEGAYQSFPLGMELNAAATHSTNNFLIRLLPHVEQEALHQQWDFTNWGTNVTTTAATSRAATVIKTFLCPAENLTEHPFNLPATGATFSPGQTSSGNPFGGFYSATSYAGNYGTGSYYTSFSTFPVRPNGIFFMTGPGANLNPPSIHSSNSPHQNLPPVRMRDVIDGASNTLMLGEKDHYDPAFDTWGGSNSGLRMYQVSAWAWGGGRKGAALLFGSSAVPINTTISKLQPASPNSPNINNQDRRFNAFGSRHPGGANFAMTDGSVRYIKDTIQTQTFSALSTRSGGEVVPEDWLQ